MSGLRDGFPVDVNVLRVRGDEASRLHYRRHGGHVGAVGLAVSIKLLLASLALKDCTTYLTCKVGSRAMPCGHGCAGAH